MTQLTIREGARAVADRMRLTITCLSEMRGTFPTIPLPPDIDRAALGDHAFFITLPLARVGAHSRNGRTYSRAAVEQFVSQINERRPEGMWGHLPDDEIDTRYDPPAIRWLAAIIDADGIAWGKGLPLTDQTREYYRLAKATNARVGTSLVAWAQMDGDQVEALELLTVDLADPARVGLPITASPVAITTEMIDPVGATHVSHPPTPDPALIDAVIVAETTTRIAFEPLRQLVIALVRAAQPADQAAVAQAVEQVADDPHIREIARALLIAEMGAPLRRPASRPTQTGGYFKFE